MGPACAPAGHARGRSSPTSLASFPMGPYHPALPQPIALTFGLRGEKIVAVEPPETGYCRRDIAALVAGKDPAAALEIVERSCGFAGHSHRLATCMAVESALG